MYTEKMSLDNITELKLRMNRKVIPFSLMDDEHSDNSIEGFVQEMTAKQRDEYLEEMRKRTKFDEKGKPIGLTDFKEINLPLLSRCLVDKSKKPLNKELIGSMPAEAQKQLFEVSQLLNGLGQQGEEEAKND